MLTAEEWGWAKLEIHIDPRTVGGCHCTFLCMRRKLVDALFGYQESFKGKIVFSNYERCFWAMLGEEVDH